MTGRTETIPGPFSDGRHKPGITGVVPAERALKALVDVQA
jgi:hypothetical protein